MLEVSGLEGGYGDGRVLFGVDFTVGAGEVVTLLGRNGMGKTTTLSAVMGILRAQAGTIRLDGAPIQHLPPYRIARLGLGLVPEGRQVFPNLFVRENLVATARPGRWTLGAVLKLFPALRERLDSLGGLLSGGEQQMLAIGRALMTNPRLLILDEATEGLAPLIRDEIWNCLSMLKSLLWIKISHPSCASPTGTTFWSAAVPSGPAPQPSWPRRRHCNTAISASDTELFPRRTSGLLEQAQYRSVDTRPLAGAPPLQKSRNSHDTGKIHTLGRDVSCGKHLCCASAVAISAALFLCSGSGDTAGLEL
jgi:branched-chain amino acid transport system ATP-binding protein